MYKLKKKCSEKFKSHWQKTVLSRRTFSLFGLTNKNQYVPSHFSLLCLTNKKYMFLHILVGSVWQIKNDMILHILVGSVWQIGNNMLLQINFSLIGLTNWVPFFSLIEIFPLTMNWMGWLTKSPCSQSKHGRLRPRKRPDHMKFWAESLYL